MANLAVHFSTGKDNWGTPPEHFGVWHRSYDFTVDAAADERNHLLPRWYGPGGERTSALDAPWDQLERYWLNPPYSRGAQRLFIDRAVDVAKRGGSVIALLPARTDTKLFHECIWDRLQRQPHPWVQSVHFLQGRVTFVGAPACAPFPSMVVHFHQPVVD